MLQKNLIGLQITIFIPDSEYGKKEVTSILNTAMRVDTKKPKVGFLIYSLEKYGIALVEKWEREGRLMSQETYELLTVEQQEGKYLISVIDSSCTIPEEYIVPKANALLAASKLGKIQQENMSLDDFYIQVSKLMEEYRYPSEAGNKRALRGAVIYGLNSQYVERKSN